MRQFTASAKFFESGWIYSSVLISAPLLVLPDAWKTESTLLEGLFVEFSCSVTCDNNQDVNTETILYYYRYIIVLNNFKHKSPAKINHTHKN